MLNDLRSQKLEGSAELNTGEIGRSWKHKPFKTNVQFFIAEVNIDASILRSPFVPDFLALLRQFYPLDSPSAHPQLL